MCVIYMLNTLHRNAISRDETELNVGRVRKKDLHESVFAHMHASTQNHKTVLFANK